MPPRLPSATGLRRRLMASRMSDARSGCWSRQTQATLTRSSRSSSLMTMGLTGRRSRRASGHELIVFHRDQGTTERCPAPWPPRGARGPSKPNPMQVSDPVPTEESRRRSRWPADRRRSADPRTRVRATSTRAARGSGGRAPGRRAAACSHRRPWGRGRARSQRSRSSARACRSRRRRRGSSHAIARCLEASGRSGSVDIGVERDDMAELMGDERQVPERPPREAHPHEASDDLADRLSRTARRGSR